MIVKVKTRGSMQGPRMGRATMSVEATEGKGTVTTVEYAFSVEVGL